MGFDAGGQWNSYKTDIPANRKSELSHSWLEAPWIDAINQQLRMVENQNSQCHAHASLPRGDGLALPFPGQVLQRIPGRNGIPYTEIL